MSTKYHTIKKRIFDLVDASTDINKTVEYQDWFSGDFDKSYPLAIVNFKILSADHSYYGTTTNCAAEAEYIIKVLFQDTTHTAILTKIDEVRKSLESTIMGDATILSLTTDIYKTKEEENIFKESNTGNYTLTLRVEFDFTDTNP